MSTLNGRPSIAEQINFNDSNEKVEEFFSDVAEICSQLWEKISEQFGANEAQAATEEMQIAVEQELDVPRKIAVEITQSTAKRGENRNQTSQNTREKWLAFQDSFNQATGF